MHNFLYDSMNYIKIKRCRWLSKFSAWCKRNVFRTAVRDYPYSTIVKYALEVSVAPQVLEMC